MSSRKTTSKVHICLKEDIVDFYERSFNFSPNEVHFSINDIINNLDNIPGLVWYIQFEEDNPEDMN